MAADDPVEVVDDDDRVVAVVTRAEMRRANLKHRCVFVVVRAGDGRVLVHQRAADKDVWPGRWDLAVGGVVAAGESYEAAAARELAEELGVDAPLVPLGSGAYRDDDVDVLARVYAVVHDGPFRFADGEVVWAGFVPLAELAARVAADPATWVPDSVEIVLPRLA